jgi:mannose-6-phosphate isomerase-like protein (cupin superfamily)
MNIAMAMISALALGVPVATPVGDKAEIIPARQVQAQLAQLVSKATDSGSGSAVLAHYGNLALHLSVLTKSGGGEIHAHFDDLMIVQQGSATLITGGTLVDRKDSPNGGSKGTSVQNGISKTITVGDVVIVPAGVPHQLLIPPGTIYSALVAKIREP